MERRYEPVKNYTDDHLQTALIRNDPAELALVIVGVAMYHPDLRPAEKMCLELSKHEDFTVRGNAVLGFGHLARRFRSLNETTVKPIIESALNDDSEYVRGQAWAAAEDATHFLNWRIVGFALEEKR